MRACQQIAVIGSGVMGEALVSGVLRGKKVAPAQLTMADPRSERLSELAGRYGVGVTPSNRSAAAGADLVLLAVKPHFVGAVLAEIGESLRPGTIVVSIAAGVPLAVLEAGVPEKVAVVRVMPNAPAQVGAGMTALVAGRGVTGEHRSCVEELLGAVGRVAWVDEAQIDAVTGLSGSGPAFVYLFAEGLADGAVAAGLPRKQALEFAAQTILGAAQTMLITGRHPGELKDMVCTPAGTTIAGVTALEEHGLRAAAMAAVAAAARRSAELAAKACGGGGAAEKHSRLLHPSHKEG